MITPPDIRYPAIYEPQNPQRLGKRVNKRDIKAQELLLGLVDLYIQNGKPIGSQTLKQEGFEHLSSATIRNYFAWLDKENFLEQIHTSGGRIPTDLAWRRYWDQRSCEPLSSSTLRELEDIFQISEQKSDTTILYDELQSLSDILAKWSGCASFIVTPRFDHDSLTHVKLWPFQVNRWVVLTRSQMGIFRHELIASSHLNQPFRLAHLEHSLEQKIRNPLATLQDLTEAEEKVLQEIYSELMVRQLLQHAHAQERVWLRSGLSNLLNHPEFSEANTLAQALHFFEHRRSREKLMQLMQTASTTQTWIGGEMQQLVCPSKAGSLLACPFFVHQQMVGLVGLIGPRRLPYIKLRHGLEHVARIISHYLTREYYVFKLAYESKPISQAAKIKEDLKR